MNITNLVASWPHIYIGTNLQRYPAGWYYFQVRGHSDCGTSDWIGQEVEMIDITRNRFFINYDTATSMLTVTSFIPESSRRGIDSSDKTQKGTYEIQLWSSSSMVKRYITDQASAEVSLSGMPKSIYIVKVISDGKTYSKKIIR